MVYGVLEVRTRVSWFKETSDTADILGFRRVPYARVTALKHKVLSVSGTESSTLAE